MNNSDKNRHSPLKQGDKVSIGFRDYSGGNSIVYRCNGVVFLDQDGELSVRSKYRVDKIKYIDEIEKI